MDYQYLLKLKRVEWKLNNVIWNTIWNYYIKNKTQIDMPLTHALVGKCSLAKTDSTKATVHRFYAKFRIGLQSYQKETRVQAFSCELCKIFNNTFLPEHLRVTAFDCSSNSNAYFTTFFLMEALVFSTLNHFFPMHPFSIPCKHQKTVRLSDVFRW